MSEDINVRPTPIQRNKLDVAMELTQLHTTIYSPGNKDEIAQLFAKYYSLARLLEGSKDKTLLTSFLPEELANKF